MKRTIHDRYAMPEHRACGAANTAGACIVMVGHGFHVRRQCGHLSGLKFAQRDDITADEFKHIVGKPCPICSLEERRCAEVTR